MALLPPTLVCKENTEGKSIFLSSPHYFFHLTAKRTFFTKWMGLWNNKNKMLDYIAVKVNGRWLEQPTKIEKRGDREVIFHYLYRKKEVIEHIYLLNKGLMIKYEIEGEGEIEVEVGVNIRSKIENYVEREYTWRKEEVRDGVWIEEVKDIKEGVFLGFIGAKSYSLKGKEYYKVHNPYPYESQRCFVPPLLNAKFEKSIYLFISSSPYCYDDYANNTENAIKNEIHQWNAQLLEHISGSYLKINSLLFDTETLELTYTSALSSLLSLRKEGLLNGGSYAAGLPWFNEFWSRDALWASLALLDIGKEKDVSSLLINLAEMLDKEKGGLPCLISPYGERSYHGDDILPLFLIILRNYIEYTGDMKILKCKKINEVVEYALHYLRSHTHNGLVWHRPSGTWMDSISAGPTCIDIQALWSEGTRIYRVLRRKDLRDAFLIQHEILLKGLSHFYKEVEGKGMWYRVVDFETHSTSFPNTANNFLLTFFSLLGREEQIKAVLERGKEMISKYGIRTLSYKNINYGPRKYHEGGVWLLTTGWGLGTYAQYNYVKETEELLYSFILDLPRHGIGNFSEVLDGDNGELIGAGHQLWSASMFIHTINRYVLGIIPRADKNLIILSPSKFAIERISDIKIKRKIGGQWVTIIFERDKYEGDISIRLIFENKTMNVEIKEIDGYRGYIYHLKNKKEAHILYTKSSITIPDHRNKGEKNGIKI